MKKILIVEDEKDMVTGLKFNLAARDYIVITAYDGDAGYQKALSEKPDLMILDLMLPGIGNKDPAPLLIDLQTDRVDILFQYDRRSQLLSLIKNVDPFFCDIRDDHSALVAGSNSKGGYKSNFITLQIPDLK